VFHNRIAAFCTRFEEENKFEFKFAPRSVAAAREVIFEVTFKLVDLCSDCQFLNLAKQTFLMYC
jgi:hypothetical protein